MFIERRSNTTMDILGEGFGILGNLKSWQMLHSRMDQGKIKVCTSEVEVWQLLDEVRQDYEPNFNDNVVGTTETPAKYSVTSMFSHNSPNVAAVDDYEIEEVESEDSFITETTTRYYEDHSEATPPNVPESHYNFSSCSYGYGEVTEVIAAAAMEEEEEEDNRVCPVCLENIEEDINIDLIRQLPCRHSFHSACLSPWLAMQSPTSRRCPCCRAIIGDEDDGPLSLEASPQISLVPTNLEDSHCLDIMSLLSDMEAALDSFGLL